MAHPLADHHVLDPSGRPVRLADLWSGRTVVLLFVRHFGCLFCREQVAAMTPWLDRIRHAGAELFVIGNGSADEARAFQQEHRLPMPVLTDPTRDAYCALGMRRGAASVLHPLVFARALYALARGFRQSATAGDVLQQGGVVVVGRGGIERYRYVSRYAGDHPSPAVILRKCGGEP